MNAIRSCIPALLLAIALTSGAWAQQAVPSATPGASAAAALPLFAVEIRTGARWDAAKPPQDQAFFREHSLNLKRLRDAGQLVAGARYAEKGPVIVQAESPEQVRGWLDDDPSFKAEVFRYEVRPFSVFYPGTLNARPRAPVASQ